MIYNCLRVHFIRMLLWWMHYDIVLTKQRMQMCKDVIAHDERKIYELEKELMERSVM